MTKALRFAAMFVMLLAAGCATASGATGTTASAGGTTTSTSAAVATNKIDLPRSYLFAPAAVVVTAGTTVTWTNDDQFTHSVRLVATGEVLGILKPGESLTHTFTTPGTYQYDCSFHPQNMKGTVTVN